MTSPYSQQPLAVLDIQVKPDMMNTHRLTEHTTNDSPITRGSLKEFRIEPAIRPILADSSPKQSSNPNIVPFPDLLVRGSAESCCNELEQPFSDDIPGRTGRVRFRSRVRITSGLNRQKKKSRSEHDYLTFSSSSSSLSGSPSSSISAPLRVDTEESVGNSGWGTLGQRVSILARPKKRYNLKNSRPGVLSTNNIPGTITTREVNERTPLTNHSGDTETDRNLAQEIDSTFGSWPRRLTNPHWWWWHIEPVVCCHCLVDSDDEG